MRARKQYRFHKEWWAARHCAEFDRITAFVTALPALRRRPKRYLALPWDYRARTYWHAS
jgi:DNA topoisomerase I